MPRPTSPEGGASIPTGSRLARHTEPRAKPSYDSSGGDDGLLKPLPSLGDVEKRLLRCDDELGQLIIDHFDAAEQAAIAEADWKSHLAKTLVYLADHGDKESADIREARAKRTRIDPRDIESPLGDDLYRTHKILAARETSIDRQIRAIQTRANAMMSIARGIRGQT